MSLQIVEIPIADIKPAAYNPRKDLKPGDPAYDRLEKALSRFDLVEPLVWNKRTGNLVGGHQRFKILQGRGDAVVPVSVVDLSDVDEKALNLALNKHSGEWNFASLGDLLGELSASGLDMEIAGFDAAELERMMATPTAGLTDEDAVPEPPKEPKAKRGDVWLCGKHRVMCGDSTVATDVERLLGDVAPNLMVTDPPYGVNYDPTWRDEAGGQFGDGKTKMRGKVQNDDRSDWSEAWSLFPGGIAYVWHGGLHTGTVAESLTKAGFKIRSQIVWIKPHFIMSRGDYHWKHEPCWYAVKNTGNWTGDRSQTTVWEIAGMNPAGRTRDAADVKSSHGTQKPVECMRRPILNNSSPGQAVYDPFLGSGTTLIAAEATGRIAYGMEIDPVYVDVIVQRWEKFTGKKAELAV